MQKVHLPGIIPLYGILPQIRAEDVDFHHKDYELLRRQEEHGIYPPKFTVGIIPPDAARSIKAHFSFFGAKEKIAMDIPLQVQGLCVKVWNCF